MPYVNEEEREYLGAGGQAYTPGSLNYQITKLVDGYLAARQGSLKPCDYAAINEVIGVLECAKLELYRRIAAPFEDRKCLQNGDVYTVRV